MASDFIRIGNTLVRKDHILAIKMTEADDVTPQWETTKKMTAWLMFGPSDPGKSCISWTNDDAGKGYFPDPQKFRALPGFTRFGAWSIRTDLIIWVKVNNVQDAVVCVKIDPPRQNLEIMELHIEGPESVKPLLSFWPQHSGPASN